MKIDWNRFFGVGWRLMVFIVAAGIIYLVSTRWSHWEGAPGWQETSDAYLQSDLTPIAAKVAGYVREVPVQDFDRAVVASTRAQVDQNGRDLAQIGSAFIATLTRVRGQVASNLIGQHLQVGDAQSVQRLQAYRAATGRGFDPNGAAGRGAIVMGNVVRSIAVFKALGGGWQEWAGAAQSSSPLAKQLP